VSITFKHIEESAEIFWLSGEEPNEVRMHPDDLKELSDSCGYVLTNDRQIKGVDEHGLVVMETTAEMLARQEAAQRGMVLTFIETPFGQLRVVLDSNIPKGSVFMR
jgi:hypothetical protein